MSDNSLNVRSCPSGRRKIDGEKSFLPSEPQALTEPTSLEKCSSPHH
jgi:hypothetical protein